MIDMFKLQLCIVYFYAGLAKLNYDWLFEAMPLKKDLVACQRTFLPLLGYFLEQPWTAYFFSWCGALFDLCICFFY